MYPEPLFEEIKAAPDVPLEIFVKVTERVDAATVYVAISSPRISTLFVLPLLDSRSKETFISLPVKTRFGARPFVARVNF